MLTKLPQSHVLFRFLAALFFLHACLMIHAQGLQGGDEKVTINGKNIPLRDVFKSITRQTGLHFFYSPEVVNPYEKVTVDVKQQSVDNVLSSLLANKGLAWVYNDNAIAIREKEQVEKKRIRSSDRDSVTNPVTITLTGKVTDAEGNAIPGATVLVKGTDKGTNTEADGTFALSGVDMNSIVIIRSVGYETREIPVKGKSINAKLNVVVNDLDETVVIAYGTTTKRLSTGNIATIKAKDIEKSPVSNPLLALQARVPGIFIEQATGLSGTGIKVRIQGQNSLSRGNDPLYVIDGIPYTSQLLPSLSGILGISSSGDVTTIPPAGNPLSFINPADIESIDILKDADATSIYGSRAAAGAILITNKRGKVGKTKVDISVQTGWGEVISKLNLLNTQQYLEMRSEALKNDNIVIPGPTDYDINGTWNQSRYTDWQEKLIGGTAKYHDAQVSVSGGTVNTQFLINTGFHKETTVFPGNLSDQKGSLHFNLNNISANQKFRLQLDGKYLIDDNNLTINDFTNAAIQLAPNAPELYNSDGTLNWEPLANGNSSWDNPLANLNRKYKNNTKNLIGNILLSYQLLPGLDIKSSLGYTNLQVDEISTSPLAALPPEFRATKTAAARFANSAINSWIIEPQITYKTKLGPGIIKALIGATVLKNTRDRQEFNASGFNSDLQLENIQSASSVTIASTIASVYKYNALFARLNYNLHDKYILNITARRDGSSRYGAENLFHNFGAIGGAWLFSNEDVIKEGVPFLSFGKFRASYGTTGNDQIGDYQFMSLYNSRSRPTPYQNAVGLAPDRIPNPYLQWEKTEKLQIGVELGFYADRFLFNVNYYHNRSSNQLQSYALPIIAGFSGITQNLPATIQNSGWEFTLNTINLRAKDFVWSSTGNLTLPRNKLVSYPGLESSSDANNYVVGMPITIVKVYQFMGVDPQTGNYKVADKDGKPTDFPDYSTDRVAVINLDPKFYGGIQNTISYKGLSLDFLFQFVKQIGRNYTMGSMPGTFWGYNGNQPVSILNRWKNVGDITSIQRYSSNFSFAFLNAGGSDAAYSDASYIRLKNLSISWKMPPVWLRRTNIQNARLFVRGQNLLTITNYSGLDPETKSYSSLPPLRMLTVGIQVVL